MERWLLRGLLGIGLSTSVVACGGGGEEPWEVIGTHDEGLFARVRYDDTTSARVPPFTAAYVEQGQFWARTVGNSAAFAQCVRNTMNRQYLNVNDPNATERRATQIARAWDNFRSRYNDVAYGLRPQSDQPQAAASAGYGNPNDHQAERFITLYSAYRADFVDWRARYSFAHYEPWSFRAETAVHEFMHWQGYRHSDAGTCSNAAGTAAAICTGACAWLESCGGSGRPPSWMTYGNAGQSQENFVAVKNGRQEHGYRQFGEPSAPYIYGHCAASVVSASDAFCGDARSPSCPRDNQLRLLASWSGVFTTPQAAGAACACVGDPRHVVALTTPAGSNLTAQGGGGAAVHTRWATGWGSWQIFHAIETGDTPDAWYSGESVVVKSFDGPFLSTNFSATDSAPNALTVFKTDGAGRLLSGPVENGSQVYLWDSSRFAHDNGNQLVPNSGTSTAGATPLRLVEPRKHLVYVSTAHGLYVDIATEQLENTTTRSVLNYATQLDLRGDMLDSELVRQQRRAAFWLIDWDGGEMLSNDTVSFQTLDDDSNGNYRFVVTNGTGQVGLANGTSSAARFTVQVLDGADVFHGATVAFRSSGGTYLTAMPPDYFDSQIRNYGPSVGAWQRFGVWFVHSYDFSRRDKW
jgi:hypothetical protein